MEKLLTVVVPVYKVEKYINKCLNSLILPEDIMEKLEVIIVNDGTPDNSAEMAREYVKKFPKTFHIIDKENGGHGSAWNRGLIEATGKYLRFLDSDDWLSNLDVFLNKLAHIDEDMIFTNVCRYYEDVNKEDIESLDPSMDYDTQYQLDNIELQKLPYGFWNWTYKTEMLKKYAPLFKEHVYYDDAILFFAPIILYSTFKAVNIVLYNYRLGRPGQTMDKSVQKKHAADYAPVSMGINEFIQLCYGGLSIPKKVFIKSSFGHYLDSCFNRFLLLDYNAFKEVMREWLPKLKENRELFYCVGNRLKMYQAFPCFLSFVILKYYALIRDHKYEKS